jgi:hypothetical protein
MLRKVSSLQGPSTTNDLSSSFLPKEIDEKSNGKKDPFELEVVADLNS